MQTRKTPIADLLPSRHIQLATAIFIVLVIIVAIPQKETPAESQVTPLMLSIPAAVADEDEINTAEQAIAVDEHPKVLEKWLELEVKKGDTLSNIFERAGLSNKALYELVNSSKQAEKSLTRIFPGQRMSFLIDDDNILQTLKVSKSKLKTTTYQRQAGKFTIGEEQAEPEVRRNWHTATISSSLYNAAIEQNLSQGVIMSMANIFGGVIDFVYDVRRGDSFNILYEEHYLEGEPIGNGPILAVEFFNQGKKYTAYRFVDSNGDIGYFNEQGESMRKAFLRAPLDFTRISSRFNPNRIHPLFKTVRPHRGIDYAASRGTPVYAAGDGRIAKSGFSKANGNYVIVKHGQQYVTKYLHLHKRHVKAGQKVKQGQTIGTVGSTGYATGPHLHYEFIVNGVHRNPSTIVKKLPKPKSLTNKQQQAFSKQIAGYKLQMETYAAHYKANNKTNSSDDWGG